MNRLPPALGVLKPVRDWAALIGCDRRMEANPRGGRAQRNRLERRRCVNGLSRADLSVNLILRKGTTKTGAYAAHDLELPRLVTPLLARVPGGCHCAEAPYAREWRIVTRAAGVLDTV